MSVGEGFCVFLVILVGIGIFVFFVVCRGLIFFLVEGLVRFIDLELIEVILNVVIKYVLRWRFCLVGDLIVVFYCIGVGNVIKIMEVKDVKYYVRMLIIYR